MLDASKGRPERLGVSGVRRLGALYRAATADLAVARRRGDGGPGLRRLEALVARARFTVYDAEPRSRGRGAWHYLSTSYWQGVRARGPWIAAAWALLLVPTALALAWAVHDPGSAVGVLPRQFANVTPGSHHALHPNGTESAGISVEIFTNNIRVTLLAFAAGMLLGLGTAYLLIFNGILLGGVLGLAANAGTLIDAVELIVPHGVLELSCIAVAGGAGLVLGRRIIAPGDLTRREAVRREAQPAVLVVLGTAPWLVLAGCVEGFVTPQHLPLPAAVTVGLGLAAPFWLLVIRAGRAP